MENKSFALLNHINNLFIKQKEATMSEKLTQEEFDLLQKHLSITALSAKHKAIHILAENTDSAFKENCPKCGIRIHSLLMREAHICISPPSELDSLVAELRDKWGLDIVLDPKDESYFYYFRFGTYVDNMVSKETAAIALNSIKLALESYAESQGSNVVIDDRVIRLPFPDSDKLADYETWCSVAERVKDITGCRVIV